MILADQKPVAKKTPMLCFGIDQNLSTVTCRNCLHKMECFNAMGRRVRQRSLGAAEFAFVPEQFKVPKDKPTLNYARHIYGHCYSTVYGRFPDSGDTIGSNFEAIEAQRAKVGCSLKIYIIACMLAHRDNQKRLIDFDQRDVEVVFRASGLASPHLLNDVLLLKKLCLREYGTFDVVSVTAMTDIECAHDDLARRLLASEMLAGEFIIQWKQTHKGEPWAALFDAHEADLDVDWLAIEECYTKRIRPVTTKKVMRDDGQIVEVKIAGQELKVPEKIRKVRYAVNQRTGILKRRNMLALGAFTTREHVMSIAIRRVLSKWHLEPDDFEINYEAEKGRPLMIWYWLGIAIQHVHMIWALEGKPSQFSDFTI